MNITQRFLKYVSFHTTSDENTGLTPSTPGQMVFSKYLAEELAAIGMTEISLDDKGYLMATLPANCDKQSPINRFPAHVHFERYFESGFFP
jgi:tripeptide aminopeptidase